MRVKVKERKKEGEESKVVAQLATAISVVLFFIFLFIKRFEL
jgi:hypothetical protein